MIVIGHMQSLKGEALSRCYGPFLIEKQGFTRRAHIEYCSGHPDSEWANGRSNVLLVVWWEQKILLYR